MTSGYIMVTLPKDIRVTTGASTTVYVGKGTVDLLKQFEKPVIINHVEMNVDGSSVAIQGYTVHNHSADVHTHYCGIFVISVIGDAEITITLR